MDDIVRIGNWRLEPVGFMDGGNGPWNVPPWLICGKPRKRGMVLCRHHGTVIRPRLRDDGTVDYGGKEKIVPKTMRAAVRAHLLNPRR